MQNSKLRVESSLFKALSHAKRLEIITLLHGHELTVNQICQMTSLRQATVSQHLMNLKSKKIVASKKLGKEIYYTLNSKTVEELSFFLDSLTKKHPLSTAEPSVVDPICNMTLTPSTANCELMYDGVRHYFCGKGCLKEYKLEHRINL